jgi:hypothetical protein
MNRLAALERLGCRVQGAGLSALIAGEEVEEEQVGRPRHRGVSYPHLVQTIRPFQKTIRPI